MGAARSPSLPTEADLLAVLLQAGIKSIASVPCSITAGWTRLALQADRQGRLELLTSTHESNLIGLAAGIWFASGQPALVHLQNSGLGHALDGYVSMASPAVFNVPLAVLVTCRGASSSDDSEPHQAIGRRTEALVRAMFSDPTVIDGCPDGSESVVAAFERVVTAACNGGQGVLKLYPWTFRTDADLPPPDQQDLLARRDGPDRPQLADLRRRKGADSLPEALRRARAWSRDGAIEAILAAHPDAALLFSNGYTARAAQAIADNANHFYNVGYMGGTLAIGWALARRRPDLPVVVVDGDQNAQMSAMKDHLLDDYPDNLLWYVLDNGVGASVGSAPSLPLSDLYASLARVIPTEADAPGSWQHPRVRVPGLPVTPGKAASTLAPLAQRFRHWIAAQTPAAARPAG